MEKDQCFHCGDVNPKNAEVYDEKRFCCNGCVQVYRLLSDAGLDEVYKNESFLPTANQGKKDYAYLDLPDIQEKLIRYESDGLKVVSFELPTIHCASCLYILEAMPSWQDGVKRLDVQFSSKRAIIYFDPKVIALSEIAKRLHSIGYPLNINLDTNEKRVDGAKRYIAPLAVAGFCFGNIMMFSLPEYLGLDNQTYLQFGHLFRYLSMILALPVMLYAANVWHRSAYQALKRKVVTIDLPIVVGIWVLFLRSVYEVVVLHQPGFFDSLAGLVFFLLIGKWYQQKTFDRLSFDRNFTAFLPLVVNIEDSNGKLSQKSASDIRKGDVLFLRHGEIIPADARLLSEEASINYSFITGEAEPELVKQDTQLFAGGSVQGKAIRVEALRAVEESYLHALWDARRKGVKSKFQNITDSVSAGFSKAILAVAALGFLAWLPFDASTAAMVFTAVLIVACPCALALAAPFSMGSGIRTLAKRGVYIKNPDAMERLGTVDHLIFDKTGTLTHSDREKIAYEGTPLSFSEKEWLAATVKQSAHPVSVALATYLNLESDTDPTSFKEEEGKGITATFGEHTVRVGSAAFTQSDEREGARVYVQIDGQSVGHFLWKNNYRNDIDAMLNTLGKSYPIGLLSGDGDAEREALYDLYKDWNSMAFRQKPDEKMDTVESLQESGQKVLMAGDGLNDTAALKSAWFGLAVSENTQSFGPSSDGIIESQNLHKLPDVLTYAQKLQRVTKESLRLSLIYNVLGLSFALAGVLTPIYCAILMPLSSVTVVGYVVLREQAVRRKIFAQSSKTTSPISKRYRSPLSGQAAS